MEFAGFRARGTWKPVNVDKNSYDKSKLEGFISFQELTDYEILKKNSKGRLMKSCKNKKRKKQDGDEMGEQVKIQDSQSDKKAKKKRKRKNKKITTPAESETKLQRSQSDKECTTESTGKTKKRKKSVKDGANEPPKKMLKPQKHHEAEDVRLNPEQIDVKSLLADMPAWKDLFVPVEVLQALKDKDFMCPTPIQALTLPSAIRDKKDIVGAAETGSGKTLAFGIPIINHILSLKEREAGRLQSQDNQEMIDSDEEGSFEWEDTVIGEGEDCGSDGDELVEGGSDGDELVEGGSDGDELVEGGSDEDELVEGGSEWELDKCKFGEEGVSDQEEERNHSESTSDDEEDDVGTVSEDDDVLSEEEVLEDEEFELEDGEIGCLRTVHNVDFDWLKEATPTQDPQRPLYALILTPTRELAIQVRDHLKAISKYTDIQCVAVVGGMAAQKQERLLKRGPEIVVATPGRLWELYNEGQRHLSQVTDVQYLVIDEADRMVEKGHFQELGNLLDIINDDPKKKRKRHNLVFSATLTFVHQTPQRVALKKKGKKAYSMTTDKKLELLFSKVGIQEKPKVVDLTQKQGTAAALTEARINCSVADKDLYLYYLTQQYPQRTLVFCNSKDCVRRLVSVFTLLKCKPLPLHADMHQRQRLKNLDRFKSSGRGLLLATDVAARGLDIPGVEHVVHFQVPRTTENYVHRSGRTARASQEGLSIMLVGPDDLKDYRKVIKALNRDEDLPSFPTESEFVEGLKPRVSLARTIDTQDHKLTKMKQSNMWFERAAKEVDIELDEDELLDYMGDSREQAIQRDKILKQKYELSAMLSQPILQKHFSGKYPTQSGKLHVPYMAGRAEGGAVHNVKQNAKKGGAIKPLQQPKRAVKKTKFKKKKWQRASGS